MRLTYKRMHLDVPPLLVATVTAKLRGRRFDKRLVRGTPVMRVPLYRLAKAIPNPITQEVLPC